MDAVSLNRLKWKCRRGLLELDLVLQDYVQNRLEEGELKVLNELLELEDNDLWNIVNGHNDRYAERFGGIVARLRAV